jgi:tetratricopeptide (TPR) repeat protein
MKTKQNDLNEKQNRAFFKKADWCAFWITTLVAMVVYFVTLAPTVTLEDSGELAVAADYLGVPHPPGYPLWTMLAWVFQAVFGFVKYHGQPNPAWSVGLMSAVLGACSAGLTALLVSRSGADMLRGLKHEPDPSHGIICPAAGVMAGLLLAFSPVLWSQSVIVEVYSLNTLFVTGIVILVYRTMRAQPATRLLMVTAFVLGLGLTNHHALLFIVPALLTGLWFVDRRLCRDCLAVVCCAAAILLIVKACKMTTSDITPALKLERNVTLGIAALFAPIPIVLLLVERRLLTEWKRVLLLGVFVLLGLTFYVYMPIASAQNPPMNWGYSRTLQGFIHAITRGQYEKIRPVANLIGAWKNPSILLAQIRAFVTSPGNPCSVVAQFSLPISLLAIVPCFFLRKLDREMRRWLLVSLVAFFSFTVLFVIFQNSQLDLQAVFICRVQYIQAHALFALWIGYGAILALSAAKELFRHRRWATVPAVCLVLLLPVVPIVRNAVDRDLIDIAGGAEQNGHDFGWQFGVGQLRGAAGILEYLRADERDAYPDPTYPPPMEPNAIFFGGTDPGRFVPTYMIFSAKVREDVFLITQNALADNTYMSVMRDLYGERIWIPSPNDSGMAFQKYVHEVRAGKRASGHIRFDGTGKVQVQGAPAVMEINGILARMIFDNNREHTFYVEESYPIPWMYPHLEPHGLIMKINREPLQELPADTVARDRRFWDWYTARLLADPGFLRDVIARKTFSKLRSAIGGLYAARGMLTEAEYAFKQAVELYPASPEASCRLATLYIQQQKYAEAGWSMQKLLALDPANNSAKNLVARAENGKKMNDRRIELEKRMKDRKADINVVLELFAVYHGLRMEPRLRNLADAILNDTNLPVHVYPRIAGAFATMQRVDLVCETLGKYLERSPADIGIWVELSAAQAAMGRVDEALASLSRAVDIGGEPVRQAVRQDKRFGAMQQMPAFQSLIGSQPSSIYLERIHGLGNAVIPLQKTVSM